MDGPSIVCFIFINILFMEYILYQLRDISHSEHLKKSVRTFVCEQNLKQKQVMQQDNDTNTPYQRIALKKNFPFWKVKVLTLMNSEQLMWENPPTS